MRKVIQRSLALWLGMVFGIVGSLGGNTMPYRLAIVKAVIEESDHKEAADGIDILDYEKHKSARRFTVNDIAGFEKLAELVNSGKESFFEKTITLTADLKYDKTVENNHNVIGIDKAERCFKGTFNGAFHKISGINLISGYNALGLFGFVGDFAQISRIILENSCITGQGSYAGGIVGCAVTRGTVIKECVIEKDVEITADNDGIAGGIAGGFYSEVESNEYIDIIRCINYATIRGGDGAWSIGGIIGGSLFEHYTNGKFRVKQCINYGTIYGGDNIGIGGISGDGGYGCFDECCNKGQVMSESKISINQEGKKNYRGIGGITGSYSNNIANCYNAGQIIAESDDLYDEDENIRRYAGGILSGNITWLSGANPAYNCYSVGSVENGWPGAITSIQKPIELQKCYWLTGIADVGVCETGRDSSPSWGPTVNVIEYSKSQMQAQDFVDTLNRNSEDWHRGEVWAADTDNINNGYPILKNVPYTVTDLINGSDNDEEGDIDDDEEFDDTLAPHFYEDCDYTMQAVNSTICVYANGGIIAVPGMEEKINSKVCKIYTDITASYNYTVDNKGKVKPSTGKVIVGITSSDTEPVLIKGKIVDKEAAKIASASIKSGQITVTAKTQSGRAYLWAIDTGRAAVSACIPVTVKAAPTAANLYAVPDVDSSFIYGKTKQFKNGKVNVGESIKVYLYPTYKQNGTVQKAKNVSYTAAVDAKSSDYFSVSQSADDPLSFEVSAKGLKDGKSVSGRITFTCALNGRKTVFTAVATNQVTGISEGNVSGLTKTADHCFRITASDAAKTTGTFEMQTECVSSAYAATDNLKLYAMGSADGYDAARLAEGTVKITKKKSAAQGKISMKLERDKKTITVTAAKGTKPVTAYYLAVYNTVNSGAKKGYAVLSVTAE